MQQVQAHGDTFIHRQDHILRLVESKNQAHRMVREIQGERKMRIRTIKPDFWSHPVMQRQSDSAKLLAIGLLNLADDEGYFYAEPKAVRNAIRPYDDDSHTTTVALRELSEIDYIRIRNHETHGLIGLVVNFKSHQVINKANPSKIKAFFDSGIDTVGLRESYRLERKGKEGNKEGNKERISCPISSDDSEILKLIWSLTPEKGKERSSKKDLSDEWKKVPKAEKPTKEQIKISLEAWNKSDKWREGYAEGIHLWVKRRQWENIPETGEAKRKHPGDRDGLNDEITVDQLPIFRP